MDDRLRKIVEENGYLHAKEFPDGSVAVLWPLMYTCAILYDLDSCGYGDRWCFRDESNPTRSGNMAKALAALEAWNGEGEPEGWHRHPKSGRRRDEDGNEWINF